MVYHSISFRMWSNESQLVITGWKWLANFDGMSSTSNVHSLFYNVLVISYAKTRSYLLSTIEKVRPCAKRKLRNITVSNNYTLNLLKCNFPFHISMLFYILASSENHLPAFRWCNTSLETYARCHHIFVHTDIIAILVLILFCIYTSHLFILHVLQN